MRNNGYIGIIKLFDHQNYLLQKAWSTRLFVYLGLMDVPNRTIRILQQLENVGKVIDYSINKSNWVEMNFTATNKALQKVNLKDTATFSHYIFSQLDAAGAKVGYGGYDEKRVIYSRSAHFQAEEPRCLHLGMDLWTQANTNVYTPLDAVVHSFADNKGFGNYGPTLILSHHLQGATFYTLYGHLTKASLSLLEKEMPFKKGDKIGEIGNFPENGDWPPHLHFQIITDLMGMEGDFPGVAKPSEREKYIAICPDPNLLLRVKTKRTTEM